MFSIRARTLSPSSSRLVRSFGFSGSRWPSFHWPSPRLRRVGLVWAPVAAGVLGGMRGLRFAAVRHRTWWAGRPAPRWWDRTAVLPRAGLAGAPTEGAAHPAQVDVAAGDEPQHEGGRRL